MQANKTSTAVRPAVNMSGWHSHEGPNLATVNAGTASPS